MYFCPLHEDDRFGRPWPISLKPLNAGVRILTLDGGGVRGIMELISLQYIEKELGGRLKIQSVFDLMVGTSTGGIIALGLGEKRWPVATCMEKFEHLARKAFTKQKGLGFELIDYLIAGYHHPWR